MVDLVEIDDVTPRDAYTATAGQTVFAIHFAFFADEDIVVYVNDVLQTMTTDYTVAGAGASALETRSITFTSGLSVDDRVMIVRDVVIERTTNFPLSGPFSIGGLNTQLAKIFAILQQIADDITRTLRLSDSDTSENLDIPAAAERASKFLGFDANGDPTVSNAVQGVTVSSFMETLLDDTDAATARSTLGITSTATLTIYAGLANWRAQPTW